MNNTIPVASASQPAAVCARGTANSTLAKVSTTVVWTTPTAMYGSSLPIITSNGVAGVASRLSIVPRSTSRVTAMAVIITSVIERMIASRPGTML